MNRINLFIKYLKNDRIKEYEEIIKLALKNNYEVISLRDYVEGKYYNKDKKLLVLRHDVDHFSNGTRMMFEIEKKYGVTSSFYFRNSTFEPKLMKEIESYGSESSLHFETIADFVKANDIKNKDELFKTDFKDRCLKLLKLNIEKFRLLLDIPCVTIASHGEYENLLVDTPNNYLTEDVSTYEYLGIKLEAYNKDLLNKVTCYISDVPIEENGGYRYGTTPFEAIRSGEKFIMFLSHPNHWHYSRYRQFKKLIKVIIYGQKNKKENFKRI